ncbi:MAG: hypothetical protein ACLTKE_08875 [Coprococcus sp.]
MTKKLIGSSHLAQRLSEKDMADVIENTARIRHFKDRDDDRTKEHRLVAADVQESVDVKYYSSNNSKIRLISGKE